MLITYIASTEKTFKASVREHLKIVFNLAVVAQLLLMIAQDYFFLMFRPQIYSFSLKIRHVCILIGKKNIFKLPRKCMGFLF